MIEQFLLSHGWVGIVIIGLLYRNRELTSELKDARMQRDTLITEAMRHKDETIRDLINRGGIAPGGNPHV